MCFHIVLYVYVHGEDCWGKHNFTWSSTKLSRFSIRIKVCIKVSIFALILPSSSLTTRSSLSLLFDSSCIPSLAFSTLWAWMKSNVSKYSISLNANKWANFNFVRNFYKILLMDITFGPLLLSLLGVFSLLPFRFRANDPNWFCNVPWSLSTDFVLEVPLLTTSLHCLSTLGGTIPNSLSTISKLVCQTKTDFSLSPDAI